MTERLSEIRSRIQGIHELGTVVNAMRGIAGARAQQAHSALRAVELYAAALSAAIARALALLPDRDGVAPARGRAAVGFLAAERGIHAVWSGAMPAHPDSVPKLADHIATELYGRIASGAIERLDALFATGLINIERRRLFPLDPKKFGTSAQSSAPLLDLPPSALLAELTADYVHAQLCDAALHAFAAENEARMEAMASAHREIDRQLGRLTMVQRIVRQDEITAEIIELAAGELASHGR